ncbi:MAG: hypothetical protein IPJ34_27575 [Myxococcales bacterium]|nr:hypothetical protein [Myxococcales bacterium]
MRPLFPAWLLVVGCAGAAAPDAGVDAAPDTSGTLDSASSDVATDAASRPRRTLTSCAPPRFPPRTDGCPCQPSVGPCNKDNVGKVCDYFGFCPTKSTRETCTLVKPSEGAPYYNWIGSFVPCPGTEAGPADASDGG